MQEKEAEEVAQCAYKCYGPTYPKRTIYDPEKIRRLNYSKDLISYVAVTENGTVIGHNALEKRSKDTGIVEMAYAFVAPEYRGMNCLVRLTDALIAEAQYNRFLGIYVTAVCSHTYSQRGAHKAGLGDCALLLSYAPPIKFKEMRISKPKRESLLIAFRFLIPRDFAKLRYFPQKHAAMICSIYQNLGQSPNYVIVNDKSKQEHTVSELEITLNTDTAKIKVLRCGNDIIEKVSDVVQELWLKAIKIIYLHLYLDEINTAVFTEQIEGLGFFFAGIIPKEKSECLVLQAVREKGFSFGGILVEGHFGKRLLNYIKRQYRNIK